MDVLLITTTEAARRLGVGRSTLYDLIRSYRLRTVKIGRRRLVPDALAECVASLVAEGVGFEPTRSELLAVFKTAAIGH